MSTFVHAAGVLLVLGLTACPPPQSPPAPPAPLDEEHAQAELNEALEQLAAAEADGTLDARECESVTRALAATYQPEQPRTANALFNAGVVWERCDDPARARRAYQDTIAANGQHAAAHNNLGVLQWKAGDHDAAAASFASAVDADATLPSARNNLATALRQRYLATGQVATFERAELMLRSALAVDSDNAVSLEHLARLYYDRGRTQDRSYLLLARLVVTQGTRVLEQQRRPSAELYNIRGLLLMEDDDQVAALRAFKKATEIDPGYAEAHLNIAMIALRFRDYVTAEQSFTRALQDRAYEDDVTAWLGLGVAQRGRRRYEDAEKTLAHAQTLDARDPRALYNLGILYHEHIAPHHPQTAHEPASAEVHVRFDDTAYRDARRFFERFVKEAKGRYPAQVTDAKMRAASIDQLLRDIEIIGDLEKDQKRLEAQQEAQQKEERKRLLDLERKAKAAAQGT